MTALRVSNRADVWLPLLRRLTELSPEWVAWKSADSALTGYGDIDSAASFREWPALTAEFRRWAFASGLGPVIACPHAPNLMHLVALAGDEPFFEVDLVARKVFLGSTLFQPADLAPFTELDPRGFRRTRPGAEGLIKLVNQGSRRNGRPDEKGLVAKGIPTLLAADPQGVRDAASLFGPAARDVLTLADAVVGGGWNRRAMLAVEGWFLLRSLREPRSLAARVRFRFARRSCPVLQAVFSGRRVPPPADAWLRQVAQNHRVDEGPT